MYVFRAQRICMALLTISHTYALNLTQAIILSCETDATMKEVAEQGRLIDLDLGYCNMTRASGKGQDLGALLPRLAKLNVSGNSFSSASNFSALPWGFSNLRYVDISGNTKQLQLSPGFSNLMPSLQYVRISNGTKYDSAEFQVANNGGGVNVRGMLLLQVLKS